MLQLYRPESLAFSETRRDDRAEFLATPARMPAIPMLLFALFWDGMLTTFIVASRGFALLFAGLHIAAGVAVTYAALFRVFAVSRLSLSPDGFVLDHLRIPAKRVREPIYNVAGFDVANVGAPWLSFARMGSKERTAWQLRLLTRDGVARPLPLVVADVDALRYMADRLNATLTEMRLPTGYRDERILPPAA